MITRASPTLAPLGDEGARELADVLLALLRAALAELLDLLLQRGDARRDVGLGGLEGLGGGAQEAALLLEAVQGLAAGHGLDAAHAGLDRALGEDHERPDLAGAPAVGAAAQLGRVAADVDDAHLVVVLLAEERHDAARPGRLEVLDRGAEGRVLDDLLVDQALDLLELLPGDGARVGEVEAQAIGRDVASPAG